ncbi:hypothetical protein ACA910_019421 [Epithemia clementina (nom. ined.)]
MPNVDSSQRDQEFSTDEDAADDSGKLILQIVESDAEDEMLAQEQKHRNRPPRPSKLPRTSLLRQSISQRRRRSSARFLNLSRTEDGAGRARELSRKSLALIYKEEIRLNAENKINSANSWDLKMIDNLEKFLTEDDDESSGEDRNVETTRARESTTVNFTKASCSLDASVKIYGHRVDNVYLTSYKVLANLNRSHSNKQHTNDPSNEADNGEGSSERVQTTARPRRPAGPTLETNVSNINTSKLDSAFDIDPLFHKMSKKFDEGGAKGLLLNNLGIGEKGCNIIFDTPSSSDEESEDESAQKEDPNQGYLDFSRLLSQLEEHLGGQLISAFSLVNQLVSLRLDFFQLTDEGHVDFEAPLSQTRRYAPEYESEEEADHGIHQETLERSRQSGGSFLVPQDTDPDKSENDGDQIDGNDFGGFDDDGFDDDLPADGDVDIMSSLSFARALNGGSQHQQTVAVLDAIASGKLLGKSDYEYLDTHALYRMSKNAWAGAAHWKPATRSTKNRAKSTLPENDKRTRKGAKVQQFVDLTFTPDMTDILRMPPKQKGKNRSNPLQFSKAVVAKYTSTDNLLPFDARLSIDVFTSLFLRPNSNLKDLATRGSDGTRAAKSVAFDLGHLETCGGGWDDGSYGGAGFSFAESGFGEGDEEPDFIGAAGLDTVRRVEKIRVGYATVAKKVDVKRLKQDLWIEIESRLQEDKSDVNIVSEDDGDAADQGEDPLQMHTPSKYDVPLSFYSTVQEMERNKKQPDVSLPFYFICMLHLANEKGLRLEAQGLDDFLIYRDG